MLSARMSSSVMHVFQLNEDLAQLLLREWRDYRSMGLLDMPLTNRTTRIM